MGEINGEIMTIETLNLGEEVSARLINKQIITGTIGTIKVEAYRPREDCDEVVKIYYTIYYTDTIGIPRKKVVREYEILTSNQYK